MDIHSALKKMPNARYRQVIEVLDLQDVQPEKLAKEMDVTVDNLYNIHRRALLQLRMVMGRKGGRRMIDFLKFNDDISDEMLAAYIDGNATDEESVKIKDALSSNEMLSEVADVLNDIKSYDDSVDWGL